MKNKKLFAILTLVCFMFTLMPVAAFAAPAGTFDYDQVYVVKTGTPATGEETEVTVAPEEGFLAFVGSNDGTTTSSSNYVFYVVDENGEYVDIELGGVFAGFKAEGDYTVYAINVKDDAVGSYPNVNAELAKITSVESKVEAIKAWAGAKNLVSGEAVVTVDDTTDYTYAITLSKYVKASEDYLAANNNLDTAKEADGVTVIPGKWTASIAANEGFKKDGKFIATLTKTGGGSTEPVRNAELTISEAGYIDVTVDTLKTNNKGQVVFEVTSDYANAGNKVIVKYGTKAKAELTIDATNGTAADVSVNNAPAAPQNIDGVVLDANVEFKFVDVNGVAIDLPAGDVNDPTVVALSIVEKPAKSNIKASDLQLVKDSRPGISVDAAGVYTLQDVDSTSAFDKEGTYVIKVALENGAAATATVKVAEMGDAVGIIFGKAPKTAAYGEKVNVGPVFAVDANGVVDKTITGVELSASGLAIDKFFTAPATVDSVSYVRGDLVVDDEDEYIGETITVMAVYGDFVATTEIKVVDKAATITYLTKTVETGISTNLIGQIKDANGSVSSVDGTPVAKAIILDKPANAVAVANAKWNGADKVVVLNFLANQPGEYKVQTIVTYGANKYISGIETITVGGGVSTFNDVVVISMGANSMIVNNELVKLDVAPFIENSRTMLQYNVLYVFGIDVNWVPETSSVVAEGNGTKVVMTLGSKVATVNGEEVALDVAPYVVNGRTVVPVGLITGVFDINFDFTRNADGSIADILFTK